MSGSVERLLALSLMLFTARALASQPTVALVPATSDGMSADTLVIVDSTVAEKVAGLGYGVVPAGGLSSKCVPPGCAGAAHAIGTALDADRVVAVHLGREGEDVHVTVFVHDVASGTVQQPSALATPSGVLAQVVKLLKKALPVPVAAPPAAPKPIPAPAKPAKPAPAGVVEEAPAPLAARQAGLVAEVWADLHRDSIVLVSAGAVTTLAGVALAVTSGIMWKRFDTWMEKVERDQCIECARDGKDKLKVNSVVTGLAIATLLPGVMVLTAGLFKYAKVLRLRAEMAVLVPEMNLALSPGLDSGSLILTWKF